MNHSMNVQQLLLDHALANDCTDPDCELHNPEMADEPRKSDLAFFYAGACAVAAMMVDVLSHSKELTPDHIEAVADASLAEIRDANITVR